MITRANPNLTTAQNEAIEKAWNLLCEHFDSCVLGICTEVDTSIHRGEIASYKNYYWHGGDMPALGLASWIKATLERGQR